ncbi:MAG TPA: hypothetical protein EYH06_00135 [Chromatiales bacterium]|nr:hypothetical protein [Thiotrichales bacterium]HIP66980.1 hypothetical protein [Chromatiales bacterium]
MKNILLVFLLTMLFSALAVQAQPRPEIKTFVDVEYVSGGISIEEEQALAEMAKDFTLKVVMALRCGDYLNNINVLILDKDGKIVLESVTDGPILYVNLQPGKYKVLASAHGEQYKKNVRIKSGRQSQIVYYWPIESRACDEGNNKQ